MLLNPVWTDLLEHKWYIIDEQVPLIPSALRRTAPLNQSGGSSADASIIKFKYAGPVKNNDFDAAPYFGHQYMARFEGSASYKNAYELFTLYPVTR
ncbi:MAG: hypothetical protein H2057_06385 [Alphaproteobacteria bacterium]|nr:hypothetical protein [Alphaproteobacteria bacterium]